MKEEFLRSEIINFIIRRLIVSLLLLSNIPVFCQVGISTDGSQPDPSAMLDIKSTNRGILPPRVALTAIDVPGPVVSPAIGLHVYNTDTAGLGANIVLPGNYYWNGTRWVANSPPQGKNTGDMLYWNGVQWVNIPAGVNGQSLVFNNGTPCWGKPSAQLPSIITTKPVGVTEFSVSCGGNVSDGGSVVTARGLCWSKSPDPRIIDSTTIDDGGVGKFTVNITGLEPNTGYYIRAAATNAIGTEYGNEVTFRTSGCGLPITINHEVSGGVAPANRSIVYNSVSEISGESIKCWMTSNLGADHQANAVDDTAAASAGWYWQFNKKQGYSHDGNIRTPNSEWIIPIDEDLDWLSTNDPCTLEIGSGWRIPTYTEWNNVAEDQNWTNWNGPWDSGLKLHAAGFLGYSDGVLAARGNRGVYWSSTQSSATEGWYLTFISEVGDMDYYNKEFGFSIRCIKD